MSVCLFAPSYNENNIIEWMDYHYKIGVDLIIVYDDQSDIPVENIVKDIFPQNKYIILKNIVRQTLSGESNGFDLPYYSIRSYYFF